MKLMMIIIAFSLPVIASSQVTLKGGFVLGNRWNEQLNSLTLGKGFLISVEKKVLQRLTVGAEVSYVSFNPNNYINIRFNAYKLVVTYYFNSKTLQPYAGAGFGYTNYQDLTTLDLGGGIISKQQRKKNYGNLSPFLGIKYHVDKNRKVAIFLQANTDFVPIVTIDPIGFVSVAGGIVYRL